MVEKRNGGQFVKVTKRRVAKLQLKLPLVLPMSSVGWCKVFPSRVVTGDNLKANLYFTDSTAEVLFFSSLRFGTHN